MRRAIHLWFRRLALYSRRHDSLLQPERPGASWQAHVRGAPERPAGCRRVDQACWCARGTDPQHTCNANIWSTLQSIFRTGVGSGLRACRLRRMRCICSSVSILPPFAEPPGADRSPGMFTPMQLFARSTSPPTVSVCCSGVPLDSVRALFRVGPQPGRGATSTSSDDTRSTVSPADARSLARLRVPGP